MATEADRVVVELIAKNDQFDANVRASSTAYQRGMKDIETAGAAAEGSHKRLTASVGNSRIAMLEFQHIARGTADQIAAGAPLTQVLAQHMGMLGQAVSLAGGTFGSLGAFLSGPWGLALTVAGAAVATLILRHKEESDTVEDVLKKRMKMHEQTLLNKEADEAWSHTLDGLIEGLQKTNDELGKRLKLQPIADQQALQQANANLLSIGRALAEAETNGAPEARLQKLRQAFSQAVRDVYQQTIAVGDAQGAALNDMNKRVDQWIDLQRNHLRYLEGVHPELLGSAALISSALDAIQKAMSDAASVNLPLGGVTHQVDLLNDKLRDSPSFIQDYVKQMRALAAQLEATAEAAKKAAKIDPIAQFKGAIIGAEGTGANRMGSSAAGFGQFMPQTFLSYFDRLFPDKAGLATAAKLEFRDVREVAVAVIDAATKDYVAVLQRAGQQITAANLYAVHLLGQRDATRLLTAAPGAQTSDFLSGAVLRGNPFLQGTAADARSAIARRIGDSSSAVSSGAIAIERALTTEREKQLDALDKGLSTEAKVTLEKEGQLNLAEEYYRAHVSLRDLIESGILPSLKAWEREYEQIKRSQEEVVRFGEQMIDDVLNPDNWRSWGSIAKTVLRDIGRELLTLAAINPLKNLLNPSGNLPTLGSVFGSLAGLFGGGGINIGSLEASNAAALNALAGGGNFSFHAAGGTVVKGQPVIVGDGGVPEVFVPDQNGKIVPTNGRAASPWSAGPAQVFVGIEASEYFDGRVLSTTGPVMARVGVSAANGGATIGRQRLARESMHRLD